MERRLIDAKEAYELACEGGYYVDFACSLADLTSLKDLLDDCTTIDAVEVVRCRECKHRKDPFVCPMCGECVAPEGEDWGVHDWAEDDGFCHKGERREPDGE